MQEAVIVDCLRTAVGKAPRGTLRTSRPDDLAGAVVARLLEKYPQVPKDEVEDVILGCAMPEAESGTTWRACVALRAGLPDTVPGVTINRFCSSGLQAIAMAADRIRSGGADIIIAGGAESMSLIPRGGHKLAPNPWFVDHRPEIYMNMGLTAEQLQRKYNISREDQDAFALPQPSERAARRRPRASSTTRSCPLKSRRVTPERRASRNVTKTVFDKDEGPRADTTARSAGQAEAGVSRQRHGDRRQLVADQRRRGGALVMSERKARELGLKPMARFVSFATGGVPPEIMGIGPVVAIPKALALAGLKLDDIDVIELNEAFAVQALAVIREAGLDLGQGQRERRRHRAGPSAGMHRRQAHRHHPARDGAPRMRIRHGHDVRRRRPGRRRNLRKDRDRRYGDSSSHITQNQGRRIPDRRAHARTRSSRRRI